MLHTLHASLWCLLTTSSFGVHLKAVNLGGDTDTTGCVAGGLAGVRTGLESIPQKWIQILAQREEVESL
ncbi:MAG: ADP-ribosylglycohydrolase family protein [Verrucomicrobiota bacterium]